SKTPGRFQAHLAAVYLQQGKWTDAFAFAAKAVKTSAGKTEAAGILAIMYAQGLGLDKVDHEKAIQLLKQADDAGSVPALTEFGHWEENGELIPKDFPTALSLYELAAEHEDSSARESLARLYLSGVTVPQNISEAPRLFHLAQEDYPPAVRGYA